MTKEEKINTLKAIIQECEEYQWQRKETLFEIIKDLEKELCDDAISRQEIIKYFENRKAKNYDIPYENAISRIKNARSVNPLPKRYEPKEDEIREVYYDLDKLELSVRTNHYLKRAGFNTIGDIINKDIESADSQWIFKVRHIGKKSVEEIRTKLTEKYNYTLKYWRNNHGTNKYS